jgi:hypothetical protein
MTGRRGRRRVHERLVEGGQQANELRDRMAQLPRVPRVAECSSKPCVMREGSKAVALHNGRTPICEGCKLKVSVLLGALKAPEQIRVTGKIREPWASSVRE